VALKPGSEGVIYQGVIYFWTDSAKGGDKGPTGYQAWKFPNRKSLHRVIWQQTHGRPVPPKTHVFHIDGNKNNFEPENLGTRSMADCARMNAWHRRPEKHPGLAKRIGLAAWDTKNKKMLLRQRSNITALLGGGNDLVRQLQRRKNENTVMS
jgi:hypothetical protein